MPLQLDPRIRGAKQSDNAIDQATDAHVQARIAQLKALDDEVRAYVDYLAPLPSRHAPDERISP